MITMCFDKVVGLFVESLLPRSSAENKLLEVVFTVTATEHGGQWRRIGRLGMFLFHRPGNYTKVLWRTSNNSMKRPDDFREWPVVACHDSAWSSDGISLSLIDLQREMCAELGTDPEECGFAADFDVTFAPRVVEIKDYQYDSNKRTFFIDW